MTTTQQAPQILPKDAPIADRILQFLQAKRFRDTTIAGGLGEPVCDVLVALGKLVEAGRVRCGVLDNGEPVFEYVREAAK